MKSPKLVEVLKIPLHYIINNNYNITIAEDIEERYKIKQQNNQLFDFVKELTKDSSQYIRGIVFVDCKNYNSYQKKLEYLLLNGFYFNGNKYVFSEKSASMSRQGSISMVIETISDKLEEIVSNGANLEDTVLAKYLSYRGLTLSSSFSLGKEFSPYVIIVDDYEKVIPKQHIKRLIDVRKDYINKNGESKYYYEKKVVDDTVDVEIMPMDGWGIHTNKITKQIKEIIGMEETPTTVMWRNAFFKGLTSEVDFVEYCLEREIYEINDIYGVKHSIFDIDIIATKSMFKGYNYYTKFGRTYKDWEYYLEDCQKNGYTWRIPKWTYSFDNEPRATKNNYQNLQCLDMDKDDFISLADYSKRWIENIFNGDIVNLYSFLGLFANKNKPSNSYMKALLRNPEMSKDAMVKKYLHKILKKTIDQMKIGKIYMRNTMFKTVIPDIVLFLEYITGQEPKGILKADEFYAVDINGVVNGWHYISRNPKISKRENCKLKGSNYDILNKYASHLSNAIMVNANSTIMARMQGFDHDGDQLFVSANKLLTDSVDMSVPIIMDTEDKIVAKKEKITKENIVKNTIMSFKSLIGEYSNYATTYNNRIGKTDTQNQMYQDNVDILSVCSGKSLDYVKTGVLYFPPKNVAKYGRPLPYFMRYASPYYARMKKFSHAPSNMNLLAKDIERWSRTLHYRKPDAEPFDYTIMIDTNVPWNSETYLKIKQLYKEFQVEFKELKKQQRLSYSSPEHYNYFSGYNLKDIQNTEVDWKAYFAKYKKESREICPNQKELANYAVTICYQNNKYGEKNFAWIVAENGILENIVPVEFALPQYDRNGEYEYLGKRYTLVPYKYQDLDEEEYTKIDDEEDYTDELEESEDDMEVEDTYL